MFSLDSETLIYVKHGIFVIFRSNLNGFSCLCHGIGVGASLPEVHWPLHGLIMTSPQEVGMPPHVLTTYPVSPRWYIYVLVKHEGGGGCWTFVGPSHREDPGIGETFASFTFKYPDSHCSIWKLGFKMLGSMLVKLVRRMAMYWRDKSILGFGSKMLGFTLVELVWGMGLFRLEKVLSIFFTCSHRAQGRKVGR